MAFFGIFGIFRQFWKIPERTWKNQNLKVLSTAKNSKMILDFPKNPKNPKISKSAKNHFLTIFPKNGRYFDINGFWDPLKIQKSTTFWSLFDHLFYRNHQELTRILSKNRSQKWVKNWSKNGHFSSFLTLFRPPFLPLFYGIFGYLMY